MFKGKTLTSLAAVAAVAFAIGVQPAGAVSIAEFDSASETHQSEFLAVKTSQLYHYYNSQPGMESKAACMELLSSRKISTNGPSELAGLILSEIDLARERGENHQVEDIIFGVIEHECSKPENQIATGGEAPAPVQPG